MQLQMSFVQKWVLVWGALFMLVALIHPAESTAIKPHSTSFWDNNMRLCAIDANNTCHMGEYARSVAKYGIGGVVVAILSLCTFVLFIPVRFCCNGFGGKKPSFGICPGSDSTRSYERKEIFPVKILVGIVFIPIVIAVGLGFEANSDISSSADNITVQIVASGDDIKSTIFQVRDILANSGNYTPDAAAIVNSAVQTATDIDNNLHDANRISNKYDHLREVLMQVGFICCAALVFIGIICTVFNLRVVALMLGIFSLIVLTIVWLSFGLHFVADKFVYDTCVDIELLISNSSTSNSSSLLKTGALAKLWACDDNTNLVNLQSLIEAELDNAADYACDLRAGVCYNATSGKGDPAWQCSSTPACNKDTITVVTDSAHMTIIDNGVPRSLNECASNCTNAANKNMSITIETSVTTYTNYTNLYNNKVLPIIQCQTAIDVLTKIHDPLCSSMFDSLYGVAISSLILGIFYIPFVVAMIIGFKRFQKLDYGII